MLKTTGRSLPNLEKECCDQLLMSGMGMEQSKICMDLPTLTSSLGPTFFFSAGETKVHKRKGNLVKII